MSRLRPFRFALDRGNGETAAVIFYAATAAAAKRYAEAWAEKRGYAVRPLSGEERSS